jgi:hypothetical protein
MRPVFEGAGPASASAGSPPAGRALGVATTSARGPERQVPLPRARFVESTVQPGGTPTFAGECEEERSRRRALARAGARRGRTAPPPSVGGPSALEWPEGVRCTRVEASDIRRRYRRPSAERLGRPLRRPGRSKMAPGGRRMLQEISPARGTRAEPVQARLRPRLIAARLRRSRAGLGGPDVAAGARRGASEPCPAYRRSRSALWLLASPRRRVGRRREGCAGWPEGVSSERGSASQISGQPGMGRCPPETQTSPADTRPALRRAQRRGGVTAASGGCTI